MSRLIDLVQTREVPLMKTLGMTQEHLAEGHAIVSMIASSHHHNPLGTLHGGVYCDLADMAMGMAMMSTLGDGEAMTTLELKINYFRPVIAGRIVADARVINRGRTSGYVECDVRDDAGRLMAKSASTCVLLTGERAAPIFARYQS